MKFQVDRDSLAEAVAWTAKSLPSRPTVAVLAGIMMEVHNDRLTIAGFDYEVSNQVSIDVQAESSGQVLVSGRLLAEITRALPNQPVHVSAASAHAEITCGSARFTLPTLPVEDYPALPEMPTVAGAVDAEPFAAAVRQVAVAAGRDDTLPMLTGVHIEVNGSQLSLLATDRYRLAIRELSWRPGSVEEHRYALVPARTLADTAKTLAGGTEVAIALSETTSETVGGLIGFSGSSRRTTTRLLDGEYPKVRSLLPDTYNAQARLVTAEAIEVVKRVALVAERNAPVRLNFSTNMLTIEAGGSDEARASESLPAYYEAEDLSIAFNPDYLLDGLGAIESATAMMSFTNPARPAVLAAALGDDEAGWSEDTSYRYVLMPVRISA
ncbi:MAG TPA: DNA polymerase III subunit beta [Mycobacteriales bacterium]|jgi:DNA polymerase-3 subunit beta|nr:DNA polymerase III subunit beta [Mycobacteriales bacterium]